MKRDVSCVEKKKPTGSLLKNLRKLCGFPEDLRSENEIDLGIALVFLGRFFKNETKSGQDYFKVNRRLC